MFWGAWEICNANHKYLINQTDACGEAWSGEFRKKYLEIDTVPQPADGGRVTGFPPIE